MSDGGLCALEAEDFVRPLRGALWKWFCRSEDQLQSDEEDVRCTDQGEAANRTKTAFLATMGHERRTPLDTVMAVAGFRGVGTSIATGGLKNLPDHAVG